MSDEAPEVDFDHRDMTYNWAKIKYDTDIWFPMPVLFKGTMWADAAEWSFYYVSDRFRRGGGKLTKREAKKEIVPRAAILVDVQSDLLGSAIAHKYYVHCPEYHVTPVVISVALWKCKGTREQAFDYYGNWGADTATTTPVVRPFATEHLGEGIRVQWIGQNEGGVYENVNYVWRNEEYDTDILVWMMEGDRVRFHEVLPDLDEFVKGIVCTTRKHAS